MDEAISLGFLCPPFLKNILIERKAFVNLLLWQVLLKEINGRFLSTSRRQPA